MKTKATNRTAAERPRYFARQLIAPADLTQGVEYLRERQRRHNRALHGWGVVYGAGVTSAKGNAMIEVEPGFILTPSGDEIELTKKLAFAPLQGTKPDDPMHSEVALERVEFKGSRGYLAIRYEEVESQPVRMAPVACGCDETSCEYARFRDCYEFRLLKDPPGDNDPPELDAAKLFGPSLPNAIVPKGEWVVLASIDFDDEYRIVAVDPVSFRRTVVSLNSLWWRPKPIIKSVVVGTKIGAGDTANVDLQVVGLNLFPDYKAPGTLGDDKVKIREVKQVESGTNLTVRVVYANTFNPEVRALNLVNAGGVTAAFEGVDLP